MIHVLLLINGKMLSLKFLFRLLLFVIQWTGRSSGLNRMFDTIKINVDAALFHGEQKYGYGAVARDHNGMFLEAKVSGFAGSVNAEMAEALGFKEALSWIKMKQWQRVVLETDCINVIQAVRSPTVLASTIGLIIEDCKKLVHDIANAEYYFVKRSANRVAHWLARQSCFMSDCSFNIQNAPSEVLNLCNSDVPI